MMFKFTVFWAALLGVCAAVAYAACPSTAAGLAKQAKGTFCTFYGNQAKANVVREWTSNGTYVLTPLNDFVVQQFGGCFRERCYGTATVEGRPWTITTGYNDTNCGTLLHVQLLNGSGYTSIDGRLGECPPSGALSFGASSLALVALSFMAWMML
jgi:hypothetical protein